MKRIYRMASKVIISGIIGISLIILSIYLIGIIVPHSDRPDVVEGWAVGLLFIIGVACALFLAGAIGMILSFNDITSPLDILVIPLFSGLVSMIPAFLIIVFLGLYAFGLFIIGLICLLASLILSMIGGLAVYSILSFLRPKTIKDQ